MAARAMWKGVVTVGRQKLPVKLYAAIADKKVHFHLLHDKDETRVEQRLVDGESGEPVGTAELRKGYETSPGTFVVLEKEELAELEPEPSRDIEVTRFVPDGAIHHQWFDRAYWLGPDGDVKGYFALVAALDKSGREGVARWVMRKRPYVGALRVEGDHLALIALRHVEEVVLPSDLAAPATRDVNAKERALAEQLVDALADHFDPTEYEDTYRKRVEELVAAKAKGKKPRLVRPKAKRATASLERALQASLARTSKNETSKKTRTQTNERKAS
jgi:DNA end-binding protein Ku